MKLTQMSVAEFCEALASDAPAPGGGSAAAAMGAQGAALLQMVAGLTLGREKYAEYHPLMEKLQEEAGELRSQLLGLVDEDTEAYNAVTAVFAMPKDTDEQKAERKAAMQAALQGCTLTPGRTLAACTGALRLAHGAIGKTNPNVASDMGVAALNLKAAAQGAWLNVLINIGGIDDKDFATRCREEGEALMSEAMTLADAVYEAALGAV